ncbi:MAG: elongation factor Ts [Alphaproteobacteria bacterium]|nr:elongation factor Ts [Alphaproteobacteria bacterium]
MVEINAKLVGELREKTGVGMMECKKALTACEGDLEKAIDFLRKKGVAMAEKKAGRVANQGLVAVAVEANTGAVVELNSETDFVAKNAEFQAFLSKVVALALAQKINDVEALKKADLEGKSVQDTLVALIAKIGENMSLRRVAIVTGDTVVPYVHSAIAPGLGKIGVLVALSGDNVADIGKKVAMHVAASKPQFLSVADVDAATAEHERGIYAEQARASGKPEAIIEKMVEGRMRKFYEEAVLLEQAFVMDPEKKVKDVLAESNATVSTFVRFNLGEGIEKKEEDFAAEVAKQIG